jgi:hypothetical protein
MTLIHIGWPRIVRHLIAFAFISTLATFPVFADGVTKKVRFARGTSSTTIRGAVIRGERDRYLVGARAGQTMTVKITSLEKNAVFQIYFSGEQESLPGAGETDDATKWSGRLPADNEYVIVVGGTRGNASYTLTISIK